MKELFFSPGNDQRKQISYKKKNTLTTIPQYSSLSHVLTKTNSTHNKNNITKGILVESAISSCH
jgi:hypothetical protein